MWLLTHSGSHPVAEGLLGLLLRADDSSLNPWWLQVLRVVHERESQTPSECYSDFNVNTVYVHHLKNFTSVLLVIKSDQIKDLYFVGFV